MYIVYAISVNGKIMTNGLDPKYIIYDIW